eukprot:INCI6151.12.p1 GENE.INCI6151.12~~INCI6151.12.p1  ORF type:complete len:1369 (+),score=257.14 INCI6151.12:229-4335(+)
MAASEWTCEALAVAVESIPGLVFERLAATIRDFGVTGADLAPHLASQAVLRGFFAEYYDTIVPKGVAIKLLNLLQAQTPAGVNGSGVHETEVSYLHELRLREAALVAKEQALEERVRKLEQMEELLGAKVNSPAAIGEASSAAEEKHPKAREVHLATDVVSHGESQDRSVVDKHDAIAAVLRNQAACAEAHHAGALITSIDVGVDSVSQTGADEPSCSTSIAATAAPSENTSRSEESTHVKASRPDAAILQNASMEALDGEASVDSESDGEKVSWADTETATAHAVKDDSAVKFVEDWAPGAEEACPADDTMAEELEVLQKFVAFDINSIIIPASALTMTHSTAPIASGGGGQIYRCKLLEDLQGVRGRGAVRGTEVAVKELFSTMGGSNKAGLKDLGKELRFLTKLYHPNIVPFFGLLLLRPLAQDSSTSEGSLNSRRGATWNRIFLVSKFASQGDLAGHVDSMEYDFDTRCKWIGQIARAVAYLHAWRIVHRDLKPENVLLADNGQLMLTDFGTCKFLALHTSNTDVAGTVAYMPPEALRGDTAGAEEDLPMSWDTYSFAIMLTTLLSGELPYTNPILLSNKEISDGVKASTGSDGLRPNIPTCLHADEQCFLEAMWHSNPHERPRMSEVVGRLQPFPEDGSQITRLFVRNSSQETVAKINAKFNKRLAQTRRNLQLPRNSASLQQVTDFCERHNLEELQKQYLTADEFKIALEKLVREVHGQCIYAVCLQKEQTRGVHGLLSPTSAAKADGVPSKSACAEFVLSSLQEPLRDWIRDISDVDHFAVLRCLMEIGVAKCAAWMQVDLDLFQESAFHDGMWEAGEALQVLRGLSSPVDIRTQLLRAIKTIDELVARFFSGASYASDLRVTMFAVAAVQSKLESLPVMLELSMFHVADPHQQTAESPSVDLKLFLNQVMARLQAIARSHARASYEWALEIELALIKGRERHVKPCAIAQISPGAKLLISSGSVVGFHGDAIVNAADIWCIGGGGGVDGAIAAAGGSALLDARFGLPLLKMRDDDSTVDSVGQSSGPRCRVGGAVVTSAPPNQYFGRLRSRHVIHSVGPEYPQTDDEEVLRKNDAVLKSAYMMAMKVAESKCVKLLAFPLISAGVFRGPRSLQQVLDIAVSSIAAGCYAGLREVHLVAFLQEELVCLQHSLQKFRKGQLTQYDDLAPALEDMEALQPAHKGTLTMSAQMPTQSQNIIKEGSMKKRAQTIQTWTERQVKLYSDKIVYDSYLGNLMPSNFIRLANVSSIRAISKVGSANGATDFCLYEDTIDGKHRQHMWRCNSQAECADWLTALERALAIAARSSQHAGSDTTNVLATKARSATIGGGQAMVSLERPALQRSMTFGGGGIRSSAGQSKFKL